MNFFSLFRLVLYIVDRLFISNTIFKIIFQSIQWTECLLNVVANENYEIVLRGVVVLKNMVSADKEIGEKVIESQLMDCLQAHIFKAKCKYLLRKCL